jgi:WD40 repeat protein
MARSLCGSRVCVGIAGCALVLAFAAFARAEEPQITIQVEVAGGGEASGNYGPATHSQTKYIFPANGAAGLKLASFCVLKDGKLVAVLDRGEEAHGGVLSGIITALSGQPAEQSPASDKPAATSKQTAKSVAELRVLDSDGKTLETFPLDFHAQTINVCPDGNLIIGGDGTLTRYDLKGKELARIESPHVAAARKDPDALKRRAKETLEDQRKSIEEAVKSFEIQKEEYAKRDQKSLTDEEKEAVQQIEQMLPVYKRMVDQQGVTISDAQIEETAKQLALMARKINAVAGSDQHLYCTAPASKGYGYSVWRTDLDFKNPERIVDGLSGCCGQMDIQCCGDDVIISENSRKRVVRFDSKGKEVSSWGKASRDGEGDTFGSCCNPMNTRAVGDKLFVSDSDGRVRLFSLAGKYEGEVGKANVEAGCKSSIVDVSPDGKRVYYIDVNHSRICVLDRKPDEKAQASR